jgi:glycerol dehydrogenase-like iron-containing ADH family enzyme
VPCAEGTKLNCAVRALLPLALLQVAFGTMVQLMCEGNEAEARRVAAFNKSVGLPYTLADLHVTLTEPKLELLVAKTLEEGSISHNLGPHLTPQLVREAVVQADQLGTSLGRD